MGSGACLCLPRAERTNMHHPAWLFHAGSGIQRQVPTCADSISRVDHILNLEYKYDGIVIREYKNTEDFLFSDSAIQVKETFEFEV